MIDMPPPTYEQYKDIKTVILSGANPLAKISVDTDKRTRFGRDYGNLGFGL